MLVRNGRSIFQNPGRFPNGSFGNQTGNFVKGGLKARFIGGFSDTFGAYPSGYLAPGCFILPVKPGAMSSTTETNMTIAPGIVVLIPAKPISGSSTLAITVSNAQLDKIASLAGSSTGAITVSSAALAAAVAAQGSSVCVITNTDATLGGIFSVQASSSCAASTNVTLTALAWIEAEAGGPTELSPEGLADALLNSLLASYNDPGTVGEALNNAGSAGNPWDALITANNDAGTMGELIQKLLKTSTYLGTK